VGPLSEGVWARDDTLERSFTFDPPKAKQLLDQAGWKLGSGPVRQKGGQNLEIALATFRSPWTEIAQAMQSQLRDVGIDLKVQVRVGAMATKVHDFRPGPDGLTGTAMNDGWVEG